MPYIQTVTNKKISDTMRTSLEKQLGQAISILPGKSEKWLMLSFSDERKMAFAGSEEDCALVEIQIFGSASDSSLDKMTATVTAILSSELKISADRIYVKYEFVSHWGWSGENF
jgi:hypothetical protein